MSTPSAAGTGMDVGAYRDDVFLEDERVRGEIKQLAYARESNEDARSFHAAVETVLAASKQRLRDLWLKHQPGGS